MCRHQPYPSPKVGLATFGWGDDVQHFKQKHQQDSSCRKQFDLKKWAIYLGTIWFTFEQGWPARRRLPGLLCTTKLNELRELQQRRKQHLHHLGAADDSAEREKQCRALVISHGVAMFPRSSHLRTRVPLLVLCRSHRIVSIFRCCAGSVVLISLGWLPTPWGCSEFNDLQQVAASEKGNSVLIHLQLLRATKA